MTGTHISQAGCSSYCPDNSVKYTESIRNGRNKTDWIKIRDLRQS